MKVELVFNTLMPIKFFKSNNSMNKKSFYTSPEVDILVVQAEGVVCASKNGVKALIFSELDDAAGASFSTGNGTMIEGGDF